MTLTVISPAATEPVTLAMARKQCKVDPEGSPPAHEDDDLIALFLSAAREWCEAYTGRIIAPALVQIALDAFPAGTITLESGPVSSVAAVNYTDEAGDAQTVDQATYRLDTTGQIALLRLNEDQHWPTAKATAGAVAIRYTVGYEDAGASPAGTPMPNGIKVAILLILAHLYNNRESTVERALTTIPMGVTFFLGPHKLKSSFA